MSLSKATREQTGKFADLDPYPANLPEVDAADAWEKFSAVWPFDPIDFRRTAAKAEFLQLTDAEREAAIRCAPSFIKAWRSACRGPLPAARKWLHEKGWESPSGKRRPSRRLQSQPSANPMGDGDCTRDRCNSSDGTSMSAARSGARLGLMRPSEWPPDVSTTSARDRSSRAECIGNAYK